MVTSTLPTSIAGDRILLVGDADGDVEAALAHALPTADVTVAPTFFDAIAALNDGHFNAILAATAPIERRPESAVRTIRDLCGDAKLVLFGRPDFEPLARKMLDVGSDDYVLSPIDPTELRKMFSAPPMALGYDAPASAETRAIVGLTPKTAAPSHAHVAARRADAPARAATNLEAAQPSLLGSLPLAEIVLEALVQSPGEALSIAVRKVNARLAPHMRLHVAMAGKAQPAAPAGHALLAHPLRAGDAAIAAANLVLTVAPSDSSPRAAGRPAPDVDPSEHADARHFLAQLAGLLGKLMQLGERHNDVQRMLIRDDLTSVYNGRFFKLFLNKITEKARAQRFPVTLLLFDIDNFKKYNDQHGHIVGDDILRATATLMRRCTREHDVVARISGDEFAVIFWEKEGPRKPHEPRAIPSGRVPNTPQQVFERFRRMLQSHEASDEFKVLGSTGQGTLTISGGMAVFPFDANTPQELYRKADEALMFGAKKGGKNSLYLIGGQDVPVRQHIESSDLG